jgi:hypothetical protein
MELEVKEKAGKQKEIIRHHADKEIREAHRRLGYDWRSNRVKLRILPVSSAFRDNYESVFGHR